MNISELLWKAKYACHMDSHDAEVVSVAIDFATTDPLGCAQMFHTQARYQWRLAQGLRETATRERIAGLRERALSVMSRIEHTALIYEYCALALGLARYGVKP